LDPPDDDREVLNVEDWAEIQATDIFGIVELRQSVVVIVTLPFGRPGEIHGTREVMQGGLRVETERQRVSRSDNATASRESTELRPVPIDRSTVLLPATCIHG
jgi:hypothetical protein